MFCDSSNLSKCPVDAQEGFGSGVVVGVVVDAVGQAPHILVQTAATDDSSHKSQCRVEHTKASGLFSAHSLHMRGQASSTTPISQSMHSIVGHTSASAIVVVVVDVNVAVVVVLVEVVEVTVVPVFVVVVVVVPVTVVSVAEVVVLVVSVVVLAVVVVPVTLVVVVDDGLCRKPPPHSQQASVASNPPTA